MKTVLKSHLHDSSRRTARKTYASIRSKRQEIQKRHTTEQERERDRERETERQREREIQRERERDTEREREKGRRKKAPIPSRSQEYFAKTSTKMAIAAAGAWNH